MKRLTKIEFEVIYLYGLGLTFKEISENLYINSKGIYNNAKRKDRQRVMRAKDKRERNISSYRLQLKEHIKEVKLYNNSYKNYTQKVQDYWIESIAIQKQQFRKSYIEQCLNLSFRKYNSYKIRLLEKVA